MNFLAHCWLARCDEALVAGGFIGDFVKGPIPKTLPDDLQAGIRLHRHIDSASNRLPEMRATYHRFGSDLRRVAPILIDLVTDHLLAKYWDHYGFGELSDFTTGCYEIIGEYDVPQSAASLYRRMMQTDMWSRYSEFNFMRDVMKGILKRLRFDQFLDQLDPLECRMDDFHGDFEVYFPLLENIAQNWLKTNMAHLSPTLSVVHSLKSTLGDLPETQILCESS